MIWLSRPKFVFLLQVFVCDYIPCVCILCNVIDHSFKTRKSTLHIVLIAISNVLHCNKNIEHLMRKKANTIDITNCPVCHFLFKCVHLPTIWRLVYSKMLYLEGISIPVATLKSTVVSWDLLCVHWIWATWSFPLSVSNILIPCVYWANIKLHIHIKHTHTYK